MNTFNNIDDNDDNFVDNLQLHTAPVFDPIMGLQRCDMRWSWLTCIGWHGKCDNIFFLLLLMYIRFQSWYPGIMGLQCCDALHWQDALADYDRQRPKKSQLCGRQTCSRNLFPQYKHQKILFISRLLVEMSWPELLNGMSYRGQTHVKMTLRARAIISNSIYYAQSWKRRLEDQPWF